MTRFEGIKTSSERYRLTSVSAGSDCMTRFEGIKTCVDCDDNTVVAPSDCMTRFEGIKTPQFGEQMV